MVSEMLHSERHIPTAATVVLKSWIQYGEMHGKYGRLASVVGA